MASSLPTARRIAIAALLCAAIALLAALSATVPAAGAQAVTDEYELGPLPDSEGDRDKAKGNATNAADVSAADDDGAPIVWIVIGAAVVLGGAIGAWYVGRRRET